jgi:DNA-binding NtrC family response regulator
MKREKSMLSILMVGKDPDALANLATELSENEGIKVSKVASGKEAWTLLGISKVDVVITDEQLADGPALPFVLEMTKRHPLVNCAMVSTLSPEDFHESTEGLGVFMQLPVVPGAEEAAKMVQLLESIDALMSM